MNEIRYKGIPASPGIAIGKFYMFSSEEIPILERTIAAEDIPGEIARFEDALIATRKELLKIQTDIAAKIGAEHAELFNAHLMLVEDRALIEAVIKRLYQEEKNVDYLFAKICDKYAEAFSQMEDSYMRERATDVRDVMRRVMHNLIGRKREDFSHIDQKVILVSYDLSPSDTALFHTDKILGFATDVGTKTSHTAIMARSLGIPAIVGLGEFSRHIATGMMGIIDGLKGLVVVNPTPETLEEYATARIERQKTEALLLECKDLPAVTLDGRGIDVGANIEIPEDTDAATHYGAAGIGLYRTEFFYMNRTTMPTEHEHETAYRRVASSIRGPVVIRTYDLGGDKFASHIHMPSEMNPFLGCRGIRFSLSKPDIFMTQLRGLLRASADLPNIKLMFPLISTVEELRRAKAMLEEAKTALASEGVPFNRALPVGVLVETPSAAMCADILARECDFFSIGTNDLIQYSLAIDRVNPEVAYLYEPFHPSILRLIRHIADTANKAGIPVGVCGETAGDPLFLLFLLGIGVTGLSMSPSSIPAVKKTVRSVRNDQVRELALEILGMDDPSAIRQRCQAFQKSVFPELSQPGAPVA